MGVELQRRGKWGAGEEEGEKSEYVEKDAATVCSSWDHERSGTNSGLPSGAFLLIKTWMSK